MHARARARAPSRTPAHTPPRAPTRVRAGGTALIGEDKCQTNPRPRPMSLAAPAAISQSQPVFIRIAGAPRRLLGPAGRAT